MRLRFAILCAGVLQYIKRTNTKQVPIPCYNTYMESKRRHPCHIALVRVGKFYETVGTDAVLIHEYCGLNFMAPGSGIPKAGCPQENLRRHLNQCVERGISVAVWEEEPAPMNSARQKNRFIAGAGGSGSGLGFG